MLFVNWAFGSRSTNVHQGDYLIPIGQGKEVLFQVLFITGNSQLSNVEELEEMCERVRIDISDANNSSPGLFESAVIEHGFKYTQIAHKMKR